MLAMAVTCCLTGFVQTLERIPLERHCWRDVLLTLPKECPHAGQCSPGGCRKHCGDYASVAWPLRNNRPKPKTKAKGKKR